MRGSGCIVTGPARDRSAQDRSPSTERYLRSMSSDIFVDYGAPTPTTPGARSPSSQRYREMMQKSSSCAEMDFRPPIRSRGGVAPPTLDEPSILAHAEMPMSSPKSGARSPASPSREGRLQRLNSSESLVETWIGSPHVGGTVRVRGDGLAIADRGRNATGLWRDIPDYTKSGRLSGTRRSVSPGSGEVILNHRRLSCELRAQAQEERLLRDDRSSPSVRGSPMSKYGSPRTSPRCRNAWLSGRRVTSPSSSAGISAAFECSERKGVPESGPVAADESISRATPDGRCSPTNRRHAMRDGPLQAVMDGRTSFETTKSRCLAPISESATVGRRTSARVRWPHEIRESPELIPSKPRLAAVARRDADSIRVQLRAPPGRKMRDSQSVASLTTTAFSLNAASEGPSDFSFTTMSMSSLSMSPRAKLVRRPARPPSWR